MILCLHEMAQPMYSFLTVKPLLRTASAAMLSATVRHSNHQAGEAHASAGADWHTGGGQE